MNPWARSSRQPVREAWTLERLVHERAVALGCAIEQSSAASYTSALQSYLSFCASHNFSPEPTPDTLSFFVVFMCHHIKPQSVESYLSGICNQLEPFHPSIRTICRHPLVTKTLAGCKKIRAVGVSRKRPLTRVELGDVARQYRLSTSHDDLLFVAILLTGFHGLLRLGELVWPDRKSLQDYRKVITHRSVRISQASVSFHLPGHKADRFFEGNQVILQQTSTPDDPMKPFLLYLQTRDLGFPFNPELWLRIDGTIPTRSWFMLRLRKLFASDVAGHSLRSGGATALAEAGVPPHLIQAIGRWASDAFQIYIRKHPVLLAAFLYNNHRT
jgi:hypothetical protein